MITQKDFENIANIINKTKHRESLYFNQFTYKTQTNELIVGLSNYFKSQNAKFKEDKFREMCLK